MAGHGSSCKRLRSWDDDCKRLSQHLAFDSDVAMFDYAVNETSAMSDPFALPSVAPAIVKEAIDWEAGHTAEQIMRFREEVVRGIEKAGSALRQSGWAEEWFGDADSAIRGVSGEANGHLLEQLLRASSFVDSGCADMLRKGIAHICVVLFVHLVRVFFS